MPREYATADCVSRYARDQERRCCTDVPALRHEYSEEEDDEERSCADPSVGGKWCGLVEVCLIELYIQCQRSICHRSSKRNCHIHAEAWRFVQTQPQKGSAPARLNPSCLCLSRPLK